MIDDTIQKLEDRVNSMRGISPEKRSELAHLVSTLRTEMHTLATTRSGSAASIARFASLSMIEASREDSDANPRLKELSLKGLSTSVEGFEASHPKLVSIVNQICNTLSTLGI